VELYEEFNPENIMKAKLAETGLTYLQQKDIAYRYISHLVDKEDLEYDDNYRVALKGDDYDEMLYKSLQDSGCCGFLDVEIVISGVTWKVGCNYGH